MSIDTETTAAIPETIEQVIAWLETQPPTQVYNPGDTTNCILCAYMRDHGAPAPYADYEGLTPNYGSDADIVACPYELAVLQETWSEALYSNSVITVAAALGQARALQKEFAA